MDNNKIAFLKEYLKNFDNSIKNIEKKIEENKNKKNNNIVFNNIIKEEIDKSKKLINQMETEISTLKNEEYKLKWNEIVNKLKKTIKEIKNKNLIENTLEETIQNLNQSNENKIDSNNQLSVKEAIKKGDELSKDNTKTLKNIHKLVENYVDIMKGINKELVRQGEVIDNVNKDLKEMDISLKSAGKQIKNIYKIVSSDKFIKCLIFVIILFIIVIIIISAVGGDKKKNFNVPHDIFNSNTNKKLRFLQGNFFK